jgi:hypothetical protein
MGIILVPANTHLDNIHCNFLKYVKLNASANHDHGAPEAVAEPEDWGGIW